MSSAWTSCESRETGIPYPLPASGRGELGGSDRRIMEVVGRRLFSLVVFTLALALLGFRKSSTLRRLDNDGMAGALYCCSEHWVQQQMRNRRRNGQDAWLMVLSVKRTKSVDGCARVGMDAYACRADSGFGVAGAGVLGRDKTWNHDKIETRNILSAAAI